MGLIYEKIIIEWCDNMRSITWKSFGDYEVGTLYRQLCDAYSFDPRWKACFHKDWLNYDWFFYNHLDITNGCGFIMVLDGKAIGHISWDPRHVPEYVILGHNCILEEYKGQGYGHMLLKHAIEQIKTRYHVKKIVVTTNEILVSAQHNYEKVGFQRKGYRENKETPFFGDYIDYEMSL